MSDNPARLVDRPMFAVPPFVDERHAPPHAIASCAHIGSFEKYMRMYEESVNDPDKFWGTIANDLHFESRPSVAKLEANLDTRAGEVYVKFMEGAQTNVAYNCLERNINAGLGDKIAFYWEGNDPADASTMTYAQVLDEVVAMAKVLKSRGVQRGDRVAIYLPMIVELPVAMLACARIGAVHSVVFAGFSAASLASRIVDGAAKVLITADAVMRGGKMVNLKRIVDDAIAVCSADTPVTTCVVVKHIDRVTLPAGQAKPTLTLNDGVDIVYADAKLAAADVDAPVEWMHAEDYLFILYTSGSTGKPKGVVHTQAGYMVYAYATTKYVFDLHASDVYWCTADCGWITGHTYITYGPMLNGATQLIVLGTVGEPINPAAWHWYNEVVGERRCAIVDTYWQTETGGHVLTPLPGATPTKPGSATFPFFGVRPVLLNNEGAEIVGPGEGNLCFSHAWPGMMRTVYNNPARFANTYFDAFKGYYFTGDGTCPPHVHPIYGTGARRDDDGYYWITGRVDDLMNVSGHLLSTAEIESALVAHASVAEAAVVGAPDDIKGFVPYAFVTLMQGATLTPALVAELKTCVRRAIGPIATPAAIQLAPALPKTRSGKITRRILRVVAQGDRSIDVGDQSSLADPDVINMLWEERLDNGNAACVTNGN